jgi:hypothetical protein
MAGRMEHLRPRRPDLARIGASLATARDPAHAWRLLVERGELPASWLDEPRRRFVHDPGDRMYSERPTRDPVRAPAHACPSSIEECALFASDVAGVEAAEAAVRLLVERLAPWGAPQFHHVLWWTIPREHWGYAFTDTRPGVSYSLPFAINAVFDTAPAGVRDALLAQVHDAAVLAEQWRAQAAAGARVSANSHIAALRGRALAELPNPFEALAAIQAAGYETLEWIGAEGPSKGAAVLVMPREAT